MDLYLIVPQISHASHALRLSASAFAAVAEDVELVAFARALETVASELYANATEIEDSGGIALGALQGKLSLITKQYLKMTEYCSNREFQQWQHLIAYRNVQDSFDLLMTAMDHRNALEA